MGDGSSISETQEPPAQYRHLALTSIEGFSVLTGLSFILSATIQSAIFAAQNLDFTAIATVEDVVMGGLRLFMLTLPSMLFILPTIGSMAVVRAEGQERWAWTWPRCVRVIMTTLILCGVILFVLFVSRSFSVPGAFIQEFALTNLILIASAGAMFVIFRWTTNAPSSSIREEFRSYLRSHLVLSMLVAIGAVAALQSIIRPELGFAFVDQERLPSQCRARDGHARHAVRWSGSRALVLQCDGTWFVITPQEDAALLRVR